MKNQIRYFKFFFSYLGPSIFLLLILSILVGLMDGFGLSMFIPLLQSAASDDMSYEKAAENLGDFSFLIQVLEGTGLPFNLALVLGFLLSLFILKGIFKYLELLFRVVLQIRFVRKIRFNMVDGLGDISYQDFTKINGGKIQNTMSGEVTKIVTAFGFYFNTMQGAVLLSVYIFLAFISNFNFAFFVSIGGYLTSFIFKYLYKKTREASISVTNISHDYQSLLIQSILFFKYLKGTGYFNQFKLKLKDKINEVEKVQLKIGNYNAVLISTREPLVIVIVALVIGIQTMVLGTNMASIILSILFFYRALNYLLTVQTSWQGFIAQIGGIEAGLDLIQEFQDSKEFQVTKNAEVLQDNYQFELDHVSYHYHPEKVILSEINLTIEANKTYAFVGESGSGKTTLINLIIGLLNPTSGNVYINGVDRSKLDISHYRKRFGYITQEPVIFNDTVYNNVTFWSAKTEENIKRFWEVIGLAHLTSVVENSINQEDTILGDNGMAFSGGQKQRISIARELFKKSEILIFDEATSALDSETEKIIQENINSFKGKYTILVIAHRLSTIKNADALIMLEEGKIISEGSFEEVFNSSSKFQRMVNLQEF